MSKLSKKNNPESKDEAHVPSQKRTEIKKRRYTEMYHVKKAKTERLKNSAIPYMQNLLNKQNNQQRLDDAY